MQDNIPRWLKTLYRASMITAPGSYMGLRLLNDKDLLPWLRPEYIPYYGYPISIIFFASIILGSKGILLIGENILQKYKNLAEIEKEIKIRKAKQDNDTSQPS